MWILQKHYYNMRKAYWMATQKTVWYLKCVQAWRIFSRANRGFVREAKRLLSVYQTKRRVDVVSCCRLTRSLLANLLCKLGLSLVEWWTHVTSAASSRIISGWALGEILREDCMNQFFHGLGSRSDRTRGHGLAEVPHHHHGAGRHLFGLTEPRSLLFLACTEWWGPYGVGVPVGKIDRWFALWREPLVVLGIHWLVIWLRDDLKWGVFFLPTARLIFMKPLGAPFVLTTTGW